MRLRAFLAFALGAVGLIVLRPIFNADFWLIRRTGQWIVDNLAIPRRDPFSFTAGDNLWIEHKWLFDVVVHAVDGLLGVDGLVLMKVALALGLFALVLRHGGGWLSRGAAALLFVLVVASLQGRFSLRAHLAGYVCLAAVQLLLEGGRLSDRRTLAALAVTQLLWANLHGSFVLGPLLVVAWWVGAAVNHRLAPDDAAPPDHRSHARLLGILLAVSCLNPYGPRLLIAPVQHLLGGYSAAYELAEWQAPGLGGAHDLFVPLLLLSALLAAPLVLALVRRRPLFHHLFVLLGVGLLATRAGRFVLPFFVVFIPIAAVRLDEIVGRAPSRRMRALVATASALLIAWAALPSAGRLSRGSPFRIDEGQMPELAADYLREQGIRGNVFNSFNYGDYLAGRLHPDIRIYINGRMDLYDPAIHDAYERAFSHPEELASSGTLDGVDAVVLHHVSGRGSLALGHLVDSGDWAFVFMGRVASVLLRRSKPAHTKTIGSHEFRMLRPTTDLRYLAAAGRDPVIWSVALHEAARLQREAPSSPHGWLVYARLQKLSVDPDHQTLACATYAEATELFPADPQVRLLLAFCVAGQGDHEQAASLAGQSVDDPIVRKDALLLLGLSLANLGRKAEAEAAWTQLLDEHPDDVRARQALDSLRAAATAPSQPPAPSPAPKPADGIR